jgi:hypothetical protein
MTQGLQARPLHMIGYGEEEETESGEAAGEDGAPS